MREMEVREEKGVQMMLHLLVTLLSLASFLIFLAF
jgi:hypothetical protein